MKLAVPDEAAMIALGGRLAEACRGPAVIYLQGPLGAGKTTLVRGFMRGMGIGGAVKSPTYTLIEPYEAGSRRLYHLDLYRIHDAAELEYLGLRELQDGGAVILVEWPERGAGSLPSVDVSIGIDYTANGRRVTLEAHSDAGKSLVEACAAGFNPG
jgi:tRNA threonylcarbamoyladenosine biosynthesis protein TsaE